MEKALRFLETQVDVALATSINNIPKIRIFQIMKIKDNTLFFATSEEKEVYKQLLLNPQTEMIAANRFNSVRISGKAIFDVEDNIAQEIYNSNMILQRLYKSYKELKYFKVPMESLHYFDLRFSPPKSEYFELK